MSVKKKKDEFDWNKERIEKMIDLGERLRHIEPKTVFKANGAWPIAKLNVLTDYCCLYTPIINNQKSKGRMDNIIFVDLLAGSGITKIDNHEMYIAGSTILAGKFPRVPFDKIIAVDNNKKSLDTLRLRYNSLDLNPELVTFCGDCNNEIDYVIQELSKKGHFLAFVDNQGLNANWSTITKLLDYPGDIFINFPRPGIGRSFKPDQKAVDDFIGIDDCFEKFSSDGITSEMLERYFRRVSNYIGKHTKSDRKKADIISIYGGGENRIKYDLIFAAKETLGGSSWFRIISSLNEKASKSKEVFLNKIIDIIKSKQSTMDGFFD